MKDYRKKWYVGVVISILIISCSAVGFTKGKTNTYPTKPIEVIIAFAPGGGTDMAGRLVFKYAEKYAGTSFNVVNKPGAGGEVGFTALSTSPPDGYTIGMVNVPTLAMLPIQRGEKIKYQLNQFDLIANFVSDPGAFIVKPGSPIHSLQDLIVAAKREPGTLSIACPPAGSAEALTLRRIEQMTGAQFNKVIIKEPEDCYKALFAGQVDVVMLNVTESYSQYKDNAIKILAITSPKRIKMMPDIPTFTESGVKISQLAMRGLAVPKGLAPEQQQFLATVIKKTLEDSEFKKAAEQMKLPLNYMDSKEFTSFIIQLNEELNTEFKVGGAW